MRQEFTIGVWSDTPGDSAVVQSMLGLIGERTGNGWTFTDAPEVDLLLVGKPDIESADSVHRRGVVHGYLLEDAQGRPHGDALTAVRPLRAMPFLDLLLEAARQLKIRRPPPFASLFSAADDAGRGMHHMELAKALHTLRGRATTQGVALLSASGATLATMHFRRKAMVSPHELPSLLDLIHNRVAYIEGRSNLAWEAVCMQRRQTSLDAFCWGLGGDLGMRHGLVPWLQHDTAIRLIGWPDFGQIGADRVGMKLSALLTRTPMTALQMTRKTGFELNQVIGFINSAALCGLVATGSQYVSRPAPLQANPLVEPQQRRSVIARIRKKLGL